MISWTVCALAGAFLFVGGDITEAIRKDRAALQGTWKVIESVNNGEKVSADDIKDLFILFQGDAIRIRESGKTADQFTYLLDPLKKPKEINLTFKMGVNKGREDRGIYLIDGDRLAICIQENKDAPRPSDFVSRPNSNTSLIVLQRTKE